MGPTRRELRLQREPEFPPKEDEIHLNPDVLRAVAMKMRERNAPPDIHMKVHEYTLSKIIYEIIESFEAVANDTQERAFKYVTPQKDIHGNE